MTRLRQRLGVVAITLAGLAFRLRHLGQLDIPTDEAITLWFVTALSPSEIVTTVPVLQPHYPTYYLLLDAWLAVGPETALWARIPSVLAGTATIPVLYAIGRRLHSHGAGLLAAGMLAVAPFAIEQSQLIRMYALLSFCIAASWWRLLIYLDTPTRRNLTLYALPVVGLVYLHYFGAIYLGMQILYALVVLYRRETNRVWHAPATVSLLAVPGVVWVVYRLITSPGPGVESVMGLREPMVWDGIRFLIQFLLGSDISWVLTNHFYRIIGPAIVLALAGASVIAIHDLEVSNRAVLYLVWVAGPMLALYLYSQWRSPVFRPRYLAGSALGLYVALASGIMGTPDRLVRYAVAALLITSMMGAAAVSYDTNSYGLDRAVTEIEDASPGTEQIVFIGLFSKVWRYHVRDADVSVVAANKTVERATVPPEQLDDRVWVVHRRRGAWGPQNFSAARTGLDCYQVQQTTEYAAVTVYELTTSGQC